MEFRCISADSHLEIRPDRYTKRVPQEYQGHMPQVVTLSDGTLAVFQEGKPLERLISNISCGKPYEERRPFDPAPGENYETSPGTGSPEQRLTEQDQDGVDAEVLFPGAVGPPFWRGIRNDRAYMALVRAYNDWLAEEYCAVDPNRLIGVGTIPVVKSLDATIAELEHCAKLGLKAVAMNSFPSGEPQPVPEDDAFYARAVDLGMALTVHVGFGFPQRGAPPPPAPAYVYPNRPDPEMNVPDIVDRFNKYGFRGAIQAVQLIWSGVFDRVPDASLYIAEVQLGWIPHWMETLDNESGRQQFWAERVLGLPRLRELPSDIAREHVWWGFNRNPVGVRIAQLEGGLGRAMWASDFPHLESDWPNSQQVIEECCVGLSEEEKYLITVGNAAEYFHLN